MASHTFNQKENLNFRVERQEHHKIFKAERKYTKTAWKMFLLNIKGFPANVWNKFKVKNKGNSKSTKQWTTLFVTSNIPHTIL